MVLVLSLYSMPKCSWAPFNFLCLQKMSVIFSKNITNLESRFLSWFFLGVLSWPAGNWDNALWKQHVPAQRPRVRRAQILWSSCSVDSFSNIPSPGALTEYCQKHQKRKVSDWASFPWSACNSGRSTVAEHEAAVSQLLCCTVPPCPR